MKERFYPNVKYVNKDMKGYDSQIEKIVLLAFGMEETKKHLVREAWEFLEPLIKRTMLELKNRSNKAFRQNLRKCKCRKWPADSQDHCWTNF